MPQLLVASDQMSASSPFIPFNARTITITSATLEPGRPVALFRTPIFEGGTDLNVGTNDDIARDGRILINTVLDDAASPITLLMNWRPDAKK